MNEKITSIKIMFFSMALVFVASVTFAEAPADRNEATQKSVSLVSSP